MLAETGSVRLKRCRYGLMLYHATDVYIGRSLDLYGEFSEGEVALFRQIVKPGSTVLDIGANIGAHTVFLARATGPAGRVLAFEPQRIVFQMLCANVALNDLWNVHTYHAAVGREAGTTALPSIDYGAPGNFGGISVDPGGAGEPVKMLSIDELDLGACDTIKLDVEGFETEALSGAARTIRRLRPALYVENDRKAKSPGLIAMLLDLGYRLYWHLPPLFNADNHAGVAENVFGTIVSSNMLCLPKEKQQRVVDLREVTSPDDWPKFMPGT